MGRVVHGASCPWGELSMGRVFPGASCPWGVLSMGRVVLGRVLMGRVVLGRVGNSSLYSLMILEYVSRAWGLF